MFVIQQNGIDPAIIPTIIAPKLSITKSVEQITKHKVIMAGNDAAHVIYWLKVLFSVT